MNGKESFMVRKIAFIFVCFLLLSTGLLFAQKLPKPIGYINDFAGVMDQASKVQMDTIMKALNDKTGVEMAVVSVETLAPYATIEEYSIELATEWGIGKRGEDTGVLLLLAMTERKIRLEIGYGLEGTIPDGLAGDIIDKSILPSLRTGQYGTGLLKGVQAVSGIIAKAYGVELDSSYIKESKKYTSRGLSGVSPILFIIIFLFFFGGGRFLWPLLFLGGVSRRGFYGGGFGSSSFRGGGFSGFGGGGFGGGGASRGF
jgi:uncharacterized protein